MPVIIDGTIGVTFNDNSVQAASAFFKQNNILGTVSQASGVPTGAVIERGSNANGEFVRFADGTQICTFTAFANASTPAGASLTLNQLPAATFISQPATYGLASFFSGSNLGGLSLYGLIYASNDINFNALNYGIGPANVHPGFSLGSTTALSHRVFRTWVGRWF